MTTTSNSKATTFWRSFLLLCASNKVVHADVVISEVAFRGTSDNACNGEDWVELYNSGPDDVDLTGMVLVDDKGLDGEPFVFPAGNTLTANTYLLLCGGDQQQPSTVLSFPFGIGADDTIELIHVQSQADGTTLVQSISTTGKLPGSDNDLDDVTYAWDPNTSLYEYTSTPTPGAANVMTPIPTLEELATEKKAKLIAQNEEGIDFFNFDRQGKSVPETGMDPILDLKITMEETDLADIQQNPQYMEYKPFQTATVSTLEGTELLSLDFPGRIRTRGSEGTYLAACLGSPLPFRLDFASTSKDQTLFGVERLYLRHPLLDPSYTREWAYPRMLARMGLPHVRTRMVNFYINDVLQGTYTLMEIPEEEYVFARNFPVYDPNDFALFQTTPLTEECGRYTQEQLEAALDREDESSTPPYAFERENPNNIQVRMLGPDKMEECQAAYQEYHEEVLMEDVVLAYLRHDEVCADTFLKEGLLDQELGSNNWDKEITNYINEYMTFKRCDPDCENSDLANHVDVENFLKTFAFYAVVLNLDSPITSSNNYYLAAQSDQDKKWKLVAYDFDKPGAAGCQNNVCDSRLIHWSITRPTCESLEANSLVGPFLSNATLRSEYLGYVQEFLDNVYTNAEFIDEIQTQISAISNVVSGSSFEDELSPDAANWDSGTFPLLPTMKARAEDLQKQLAAIEDGSYPRGMESSSSSEAWEPCADWQLSEPDTTVCEAGCQYEGCRMTGWTVESFCDESTGTCYHGNEDEACAGIADGDVYAGMEESSFCRFAAGISVKTLECPADESPETETGSSLESSTGGRSLLHSALLVFASIFLICRA